MSALLSSLVTTSFLAASRLNSANFNAVLCSCAPATILLVCSNFLKDAGDSGQAKGPVPLKGLVPLKVPGDWRVVALSCSPETGLVADAAPCV